MDNLPRYFVMESLSNNKYLRDVHEDGSLHGYLEFSGEEAISPYTKYEMEPANNQAANSGLFNIRCCYNNKYWARREKSSGWITATADEPVEDPSKWSCTMFQPSSLQALNKKSTLRLHHVQCSRNATVFIGDGSNPKYASCLNTDANVPVLQGDTNTVFLIIDFETFVILPKRVIFKGDNGHYLEPRGEDNNLRSSESLGGRPEPENEVIYTRDGSVRFKIYDGNIWRRDKDIITADSTVEDKFSLFSIHKHSHGVNEVVLFNIGRARFCVRLSDNTYSGTLFMRKETVLRVEEPVLWRKIYNINFRLNNARIYNRSDVLLVSKRLGNSLSIEQVATLNETITKETTRSWKSNVSLQLGTPTTIETEIPLIVDGDVGLWDGNFSGPYDWGANVKGSQTLGISDYITIPAYSAVMVHVIATQATCDVPFTYMQRDGLPSGKVTINKMDDGVYTGINYYNVKTRIIHI